MRPQRENGLFAYPNWITRRLTITQRAVAFQLILTIAVAGLLAGIFLASTAALLRQDLEAKSSAIGASLVEHAKLGILVQDRTLLEQTIEPYLLDPDVHHITILTPDGDILVSKPHRTALTPANEKVLKQVLQTNSPVLEERPETLEIADQDSPQQAGYLIALPVWRDRLESADEDVYLDDYLVDEANQVAEPEQEAIGVVLVHMTTERVDDTVGNIIRRSGFYAAALALVGLSFAAILLRRWLSPLQKLTNKAQKIRRSGLEELTAEDLQNTDETRSQDELALLDSAFTDMIRELRHHSQLQEEQRERLEQKVVERTMEVTMAKEEAEAANAAKSRFLASMSHELRTPLNAVIGFSEMLMQDMLVSEDQKREYLTYICDSGKHLLDIINDILDLSKLEAGRFDLQFNDAYLDQIVDSAVATSQPLINRKKLNLTVTCPSLDITTDARILKQAIINLVSNAVKFTPADGSISVTAKELGDRFELTVADSGIGMSEEEVEVAMKPFAQVSDHMYVRQNEGSGTGLGLPLVEHFVMLMKGDMHITSQKGEGTAVTITLPIHPNVKEIEKNSDDDFDYI